jgi:hypothetical protein
VKRKISKTVKLVMNLAGRAATLDGANNGAGAFKGATGESTLDLSLIT